MSAMHPESGVPPEDARNSIPNDVEASVNCQELWYSTSRCQPRFDPAAANAMLAELINLINKGEVVYDCNRLDQVQFAVRYIVQRGLPRSCVFMAGPSNFLSTLDPQCTRYNDRMTLTIIPNVDNEGAVTLDLDGLGPRPILRNDGLPLETRDLLAYKPEIIAYWKDAWYVCGLVRSQMPCVLEGSLIRWVRTDGSDTTGDGSENTPAKAFRTIQYAWDVTTSGCAAAPGAGINIMLGIPGNYEGAILGPYGGTASVVGDVNNSAAYRIMTKVIGGSIASISLSSNSFLLAGVNLVLNHSMASGWAHCLGIANCSLWLDRCQFTLEANNPGIALPIGIIDGSTVACVNNQVIEGNGNSCTWGKYVRQSRFNGAPGGTPVSMWTWRNINFRESCYHLQDQSVVDLGNMQINPSATSGKRYDVQTNGVFYRNGLTIPGDTAGTVGTQGQVF